MRIVRFELVVVAAAATGTAAFGRVQYRVLFQHHPHQRRIVPTTAVVASPKATAILHMTTKTTTTTTTTSVVQQESHSNGLLMLQTSKRLPHSPHNRLLAESTSSVDEPLPVSPAQRHTPGLSTSVPTGSSVLMTLVAATVWTLTPEAALAAATTTTTSTGISPVIINALLAYGHYLCLLIMTALLTYERVTVKAAMSVETEKSLVVADALYGLVAVAVFATGYLRLTDTTYGGKGWEFYAHEPFFWLKLAAGGILAGLSLFPTITFVRRGQALFVTADPDTKPTTASGTIEFPEAVVPVVVEPMSPALAARLHKVLNAELTAVATMPLMATFMARGVGYADWLPWQAGAAVAASALLGSSYIYAKQALTWNEADQTSTDSA